MQKISLFFTYPITDCLNSHDGGGEGGSLEDALYVCVCAVSVWRDCVSLTVITCVCDTLDILV